MATTNNNFKVKNGLDAGGDISASGFLKSNNSSGDEGGQIDLAKAVTNTTLTTGVTLDVYQNKLRIFETGGTNRGFYIDITTGGTSAGSNLVSGGGGTTTNPLTISSPLSGTSFNGSSAVSIGLSSGYGDTQNPYASKTANTFLAAPNGSAGVPTFRGLQVGDMSTLNSPTTSGQFLYYAPAGNGMAWSSTPGLTTGGGTMSGALVLAAGTSTPLIPLTFTSNTSTPTAVSGGMDYDGTVFYATSKTNPGRAALAQNYYYISNSNYAFAMDSAALPYSLLATGVGITVPAGTTYEYEAFFAIQGSFIATSQTPTITISNLSGTATLAHTTLIETGNNTTGFTTASTLGATRITAGQALTALTTGNRYYIVKMRGTIRVTGSGTAEIAPTIRPNVASVDNGWSVADGGFFKLTPIGNGTVTTVGAWA